MQKTQEAAPVTVSEALKTHAKSVQGSKIDAKSILLVDLQGAVEEPTNQTLSLLGARPSAKYRQSVARLETEGNEQPEGQEPYEFIDFTKPKKRF